MSQDAQKTQANPALPSPKVMVWYTAQVGDKATSGRFMINGSFDIRFEAEIARLEAHIKAQLSADTVMITNWRSLEG